MGDSYLDKAPHWLGEQSLALLASAFHRHASLKTIAGFGQGDKVAKVSHKITGTPLYGFDAAKAHEVLNDWMSVALMVADIREPDSYGSSLDELDLRGNDLGIQSHEVINNTPYFHFAAFAFKLIHKRVLRVNTIMLKWPFNAKRGFHHSMYSRVGFLVRDGVMTDAKENGWRRKAWLSFFGQSLVSATAWISYIILAIAAPRSQSGCHTFDFRSTKDKEEKDWWDIPREHRLARGVWHFCVSKEPGQLSLDGLALGLFIMVFAHFVAMPIFQWVGTHPPSLVSVRCIPQHADTMITLALLPLQIGLLAYGNWVAIVHSSIVALLISTVLGPFTFYQFLSRKPKLWLMDDSRATEGFWLDWSARVGDDIDGEAVVAVPYTAHAPLENAAALAGKIALVGRRDFTPFNDQVARAALAGARAVVIVNCADDASTAWARDPDWGSDTHGFYDPEPVPRGEGSKGLEAVRASCPIPAMLVREADGKRLLAEAARVRIGLARF